MIEASVDDDESLERMAAQTRVLLTTVGPFIDYGEPVVRACVKQGTDYIDSTGEPNFLNLLLGRYAEEAAAPQRARGAELRLRQHSRRPRRAVHRQTAAERAADSACGLSQGQGRVLGRHRALGDQVACAPPPDGVRRLRRRLRPEGASGSRRRRSSAGPISAGGPLHCRRSTERSCCAARRRSSVTAPISATRITRFTRRS